MAIDDLYTVTFRYCTPGGPVSISQDYKQTDGTNDADTLQALCLAIETGWMADLLLALSVGAEADLLEAQPEAGVNEVPGYLTLTGDIGAVVGEPLPNNVAAIVSQLTDAPNSNANGRIFVAGVSELAMDTSIFDVAQTVLMQAFADSIDDIYTAIGTGSAEFTPVVISRILAGVPRVPAMAFNVLSNLAKADPRQQRRRTTRRHGVS